MRSWHPCDELNTRSDRPGRSRSLAAVTRDSGDDTAEWRADGGVIVAVGRGILNHALVWGRRLGSKKWVVDQGAGAVLGRALWRSVKFRRQTLGARVGELQSAKAREAGVLETASTRGSVSKRP